MNNLLLTFFLLLFLWAFLLYGIYVFAHLKYGGQRRHLRMIEKVEENMSEIDKVEHLENQLSNLLASEHTCEKCGKSQPLSLYLKKDKNIAVDDYITALDAGVYIKESEMRLCPSCGHSVENYKRIHDDIVRGKYYIEQRLSKDKINEPFPYIVYFKNQYLK